MYLFLCRMGKNKNGKKGMNPVFRVAGGKAAKAKAKLKAQPVGTNLKKVPASLKCMRRFTVGKNLIKISVYLVDHKHS